jgi:hypothetical protein
VREQTNVAPRVRGGFTVSTANGMLELSIGITRAVALNNQLVALSQVVLPDAASPQATLLATVPGATVNVAQGAVMVQNGPGNVAPSLASLTGAAQPLIVQNSLNDQTLRTLTIINASVNSLSTWRALQLGELARQAGAPFGR